MARHRVERPRIRIRLRKNDLVEVITGRDRGKRGKVLQVLPEKGRVVVQGVNIRAKHIKPSQANPQGGVVRREMPIHMSKVSPMVDGKPTRVRFVTDKSGHKSRVAVKGGKALHAFTAKKK